MKRIRDIYQGSRLLRAKQTRSIVLDCPAPEDIALSENHQHSHKLQVLEGSADGSVSSKNGKLKNKDHVPSSNSPRSPDNMNPLRDSHTTNSFQEKDDAFGGRKRRTSVVDSSCEDQTCWRLLSHRDIMAVAIILLGGAASGAFLGLGVRDANESSETHFEQIAKDMIFALENAWQSYEIFGLWAHESCSQIGQRAGADTTTASPQDDGLVYDQLAMCTRDEFQNIYEQMLSQGLGIYSLQYATRVEAQYREALEAESRSFLQEKYPDLEYNGFTVLNEQYQLVPAPNTSRVYYPLHYVLPWEDNLEVVDLDVYGNPGGVEIMDAVFESWQPSLSPRRTIVQDRSVYSVFLTHPGSQTSVNGAPYSVVSLVVRVPDLLAWASRGRSENDLLLFLYDVTEATENPFFLGGVRTSDHPASVENLQETYYYDLPISQKEIHYQRDLVVVDRRWRVVVLPSGDAHDARLSYIILAGTFIFAAFLLVAFVFRRYLERISMINLVKSQAESEKAKMALSQVRRERSLNEYLSHEIRNPLASALAALSFVASNTGESHLDHETKDLLLNDVHIVESSLDYINDLLRSMLDINKAASGRIKTEVGPTDILRDVLEPAAAILCMRGGSKVKIETISKPTNLVCITDRLRLKQVVLNLAVNSTKFVERGFIRLRSEVVDNSCLIIVEDSGPGVPIEKRGNLFESFQNSLDVLEQGTGLGLGICKHLAGLMDSSLSLDPSYDSGVEGCPGARFIFNLHRPPSDDRDLEEICDAASRDSPDLLQHGGNEGSMDNAVANKPQLSNVAMKEPNSSIPHMSQEGVTGPSCPPQQASKEEQDEVQTLPEHLRVLFVDDETILRRLFIRTIQKIAPLWEVTEASSGNAALLLAESNEYDLIFLDQYMPSIERPLLGTEVTRLLRAKEPHNTQHQDDDPHHAISHKLLICGLSANDMRHEFLQAGANWFLLKPFPCRREPLMAELRRILQQRVALTRLSDNAIVVDTTPGEQSHCEKEGNGVEHVEFV